MMLRSSSTPILGSLLSSYSESPNHNHNHNHPSDFNSPKHPLKKLSIHQSKPLNLITPSEFSSDERRINGFRRVQSDGNLEGLASDSYNSFDEFNNSIPIKKFPRKPNCSVLQTIPSFSVRNKTIKYESGEEYDSDEQDDDEDEIDQEINAESEDSRLGFNTAYMNNSKGFGNRNLVVVVEEKSSEDFSSKMHLAMGLGAVTGGFNGGGGGGNGGGHGGFDGGDDGIGGGDGGSMEEYYKKMVDENPGNPLFLRNYAQFLHQSKRDLGRAEEYYSRAILVDPGDGEILSQYAQLTWELHHDEERASSYFERAVQAAPEDSHVLAAYAGFLWETEDESENDMPCTISPFLHESPIAV